MQVLITQLRGKRLRSRTVSDTPSPRVVHKNLILLLACLGQFMVVLDVAVVNIALPQMRIDLGFSPTGLQWVVNAYTLTFAGFLLLGGRVADLWGRRRMYLVGLFIFTIASLVCGLAPNGWAMITARAVQGVGAAVLSPVTLIIVTTTFTEPRERSRALGLWSGALASGGAVGVLIGGILTDLLSWRWIFFINIPVGVIALLVARWVIPESHGAGAGKKLDVAGAITITGSLTAFVYGIVQTNVHGWTSTWTWTPIAAAAVLLAAFLFIELRVASSPIVSLGLMKSRVLTGANIAMACVGGSMFAMWYFVSLYLQEVLYLSPLQAGVGFIPAALIVIVGAQIAGRVMPRTGPMPLLVVAGVIITAALYWMSHLSADGSYWADIVGPISLVSLGLGLSFPPGTYAAMSAVEPAMAGLASGLVNASRQVGGAIGLAILASVAAHRTTSLEAGESVTAALADGYGRAILVGAVIALGIIAAAFLIPRSPPETPRQ